MRSVLGVLSYRPSLIVLAACAADAPIPTIGTTPRHDYRRRGS